MNSSLDSSHAKLPFSLSLTPPSRCLTSPTPPLFGMPTDKASIGPSSSPYPSQRSLDKFMSSTPRQRPANNEVANSISPSPRHTQTPRSVTRYTRSPVAAVTVNVYPTPRGGQAEHQSSPRPIRSPSPEILAQIELDTEEDDDHGDRFKELLIEAKETFTDKDPDFVINDPGVETRTVVIANNEPAELVFELWDEMRRRGFWTLDAGDHEKYIVKHFNKGRHYRAWHGVDAKYDDEPVARQKITSKNSHQTGTTRDSRTVASEYWDNEGDGATPARLLRRRSHSQIMPYTTEKINHKRALQGKPKRREDFDYDAFRTRSKARQVSPDYASVKKRRTSSKSDSRTLTPFGSQQEAMQETVYKQTRLNTRLSAALTDLTEVVYLEEALTMDALFAEVTQAWHSKIAGEGEVKLALNFPWLDKNDTNSTLSVRQDRPRSFDRMMEMINKAPCWKEGGNVECVVNVQVMTE